MNFYSKSNKKQQQFDKWRKEFFWKLSLCAAKDKTDYQEIEYRTIIRVFYCNRNLIKTFKTVSHMKNFINSIMALAFSTTLVAQSEQSSNDVVQIGEDNQVSISQSSSLGVVLVSQEGNKNNSDVDLRNDFGGGNALSLITQEQVGNNNAIILSVAGEESEIYQRQIGDNNEAGLSIGFVNSSAITQEQLGNDNSASINVEGNLYFGRTENAVKQLQTGNANTSIVGVNGSFVDVKVSQIGNVNQSTINDLGLGTIIYQNQEGDANSADARSIGTSNIINQDQIGNANIVIADIGSSSFDNAYLEVSQLQIGNDNSANTIINGGRNNEVTQRQIGNGNVAQANQYLESLGAQSKITQEQYGNNNVIESTQEIEEEDTFAEKNDVDVIQYGNNNYALTLQTGSGNDIFVNQEGNANTTQAIQVGTENRINVTTYSSSYSNTVLQQGAGNSVNVSQFNF